MAPYMPSQPFTYLPRGSDYRYSYDVDRETKIHDASRASFVHIGSNWHSVTFVSTACMDSEGTGTSVGSPKIGIFVEGEIYPIAGCIVLLTIEK